ncbi:MAG TPA: hypothetical protein VD999_02390 [Vitreimonas sp.]|nr:hypothetical protein [Vitreimonas sp.]
MNELNFYQAGQGALPGVDGSVTKAGDGFGAFLGSVLSGVMVVAALLVLLYLVWGAITWITAGGDKGQIEKARNKITGAIIGIIVLASTIALFVVLQNFLGINVVNFGAGVGGSSTPAAIVAPATTGTGGTGGSGGTGGGGGCTVGQMSNDGGAGGYCTDGAAMVRCNKADKHLSYNHYDPCYCIGGAAKQKPGYDFNSC